MNEKYNAQYSSFPQITCHYALSSRVYKEMKTEWWKKEPVITFSCPAEAGISWCPLLSVVSVFPLSAGHHHPNPCYFRPVLSRPFLCIMIFFQPCFSSGVLRLSSSFSCPRISSILPTISPIAFFPHLFCLSSDPVFSTGLPRLCHHLFFSDFLVFCFQSDLRFSFPILLFLPPTTSSPNCFLSPLSFFSLHLITSYLPSSCYHLFFSPVPSLLPCTRSHPSPLNPFFLLPTMSICGKVSGNLTRHYSEKCLSPRTAALPNDMKRHGNGATLFMILCRQKVVGNRVPSVMCINTYQTGKLLAKHCGVSGS